MITIVDKVSQLSHHRNHFRGLVLGLLSTLLLKNFQQFRRCISGYIIPVRQIPGLLQMTKVSLCAFYKSFFIKPLLVVSDLVFPC